MKRNTDAALWCGLNRPDMDIHEADVAIFGIAYDGGVSYRGGAAEAPALLRANTRTSTPFTEQLDDYRTLNVVDLGDFDGEERDRMFSAVQEQVAALVSRNIPFTMVGGDHSVTIPVLRGIDQAIAHDFGIIHIDAHLDLCDTLGGDHLSHGSTERRALELPHVPSTDHLFFIGIRSIEPDEFDFLLEHPVQVRTAYDCFEQGIEAIAQQCIDHMKDFSSIYLTFDIDALDPAYAGGTGTPQFGGLSSRMAMTLIDRLFTALPIIGFDVVEIAPALDDSLNAMYAGRKIIQQAWGHWADHIGKLRRRPR